MSTNVMTSFRFVYSSFIYLHKVGDWYSDSDPSLITLPH